MTAANAEAAPNKAEALRLQKRRAARRNTVFRRLYHVHKSRNFADNDYLPAVKGEAAPEVGAPAAAKAEGAKEEGGSPLPTILGTVGGIIVVAIAAFSSNYKSAEAYAETLKEKTKEAVEKAKETVEAGKDGAILSIVSL